MQEKNVAFLIKNIRVPVAASEEEVLRFARKKIYLDEIQSIGIYKKSVDARHKDNLTFVYSVRITAKCDPSTPNLAEKNVEIRAEETTILPIVTGEKALENPPVIVGFGPCGMFAALLLAENGFCPIVIERGDDIPERILKVDAFNKNGILDADTNIQFGAGGAGTFSDGKLVTRINDTYCDYVLQTLQKFGAPDEILYQAKPHIGTDELRKVVTNIKNKILSLGGKIYFQTKLEKINCDAAGKAYSITTTQKGEIPCGVVLLAIGHSARDTYGMLQKANFSIQPKAFSVGVRIEHLQADIDRAFYGRMAGNPILPPAEYALSYRCKERAVYTFCMCPGGEVVAASSEEGGVVTNGMSSYKRDGKNANSAIAVSVNPADYGDTPEGAIDFQRQLEQAAYHAGGSNYNAPVQTVGDFHSRQSKTRPRRIQPSYGGGNRYQLADLWKLLPSYAGEMLDIGLGEFQKKITGFAAPDAVLTGIETRTSAPVRILRNDEYVAIGFENVYPCGEGAGYAGGITSAAVDGIHCALRIMSNYCKK